MPNWKKVIVSGSNAFLANITASGDISASGKFIASLQIKIEQEFDKIQKEFEAGPPELQDKKGNKKPIKKQ